MGRRKGKVPIVIGGWNGSSKGGSANSHWRAERVIERTWGKSSS